MTAAIALPDCHTWWENDRRRGFQVEHERIAGKIVIDAKAAPPHGVTLPGPQFASFAAIAMRPTAQSADVANSGAVVRVTIDPVAGTNVRVTARADDGGSMPRRVVTGNTAEARQSPETAERQRPFGQSLRIMTTVICESGEKHPLGDHAFSAVVRQ